MTSLIRTMKSDWMKTKRTAFRYIVTLGPIIFPIMILAYISNYALDYAFQLRVYNIYFSIVGIALPMLVAILTGINIMGEENAGDFRGLITNPISRITIYLSKLFMLLLITVIDMLISTGILLIGMKIISKGMNIEYGIFLQGTLFTIVGSLFLYGLYLIISIGFGIGPTIAIGAGGAIWGALLQTGLGDGIWKFVPWSWSGRLGILPYAMMPGYAKFFNIDNIQGFNGIIKNAFNEEMWKGMPMAIISFIAILIGGLLWFEGWEGRKIHQ